MNRDQSRWDAIDHELSRIEFPGENESWIRTFLEERRFVDEVMRAVAQTRIRLSRVTVWGAIAVLNVAILVVAWANPFLVEDVLSLRNELAAFFYGFLGLTLAGCIVGLVLSIDFGRLEQLFAHLGKELSLDRLRDRFRHR
jgi:hypothetical protein